MTRGPRTGRAWRRLCARVKAEETHCRICGLPVDTSLPGTDRWGPTVHHLVPLNRGGQLLRRDNVGIAHSVCNSTVGDRLLSEIPVTMVAGLIAQFRRGAGIGPTQTVATRTW